jgi:hypothetical protein
MGSNPGWFKLNTFIKLLTIGYLVWFFTIKGLKKVAEFQKTWTALETSY